MRYLTLLVCWSCAISFTDLNDCTVTVNVSCKDGGTTLKMDKDKIDQCLKDEDCDHGIYDQKNQLLMDPFDDATNLVKEGDTDKWTLTLPSCRPLTLWEFRCHKNLQCNKVVVCYRDDETSKDKRVSTSSSTASHCGSLLTMWFTMVVLVMVMGG